MNKPLQTQTAKSQLISRILGKKQAYSDSHTMRDIRNDSDVDHTAWAKAPTRAVSESFTRFDRHPAYEKMLISKAISKRLGLDNPFFRMHDGLAGAKTHIAGREYINFASYNYLGLAGHPAVNQAAHDAIDRYGTTASASRLVAGERPVQRELEHALAQNYDVEACVVFVSGHATNVNTIGYLFGPKDLVVHDSLIHNSVLMGIQLSGATRRAFPHNDMVALDRILGELRPKFERVLVVGEGVYSMDGDLADLPALVEVKRRHQAFLMIDEAHSLGVTGKTGRGTHEHFGVAGRDVDIWMGTLSKTLAGCGGYIAGERALVEHLKYAAPGFVYSVGITPSLAAASLAALRIMQQEPQRVAQLQQRSLQCLHMMQGAGINTGYAQGYAVIPAIVSSSVKAVKLSNSLLQDGINVQPIIYPAVEEKAARLRFFVSCDHTVDDLEHTVAAVAQAAG